MRAAPFEIPGATELERLVARSRLIGADPALVLHGGGNTSSKIVERDHVGRERIVLRIKGTGMDLATIGPDGFAGLFLDELLLLQERESMPDEEVIDYVARCLVDPRAPRPSIETLLHAFVPATHVDHVHADAVCALANGRKSRSIVHDALGKDVASIGYVRPGFELSRRVAEACSDHRAAVLLKHGLVTWGETHEASYGLMLDLVERAETYLSERTRRPRPRTVPDIGDDDLAEILTRLRGRLSRTRRQVLLVDRSQRWLADRRDVADIASARATPDHLLRISTGGIVVVTAAEVEPAVDGFESAYRAYFDRNRVRLPAGTPMRSPLPNVILVPGLGCVTASSDARSARVNAELALHSHSVGAHLLDGLDELEGLSDEEAFDVDYWPSELYKLTLAPPPPEFSGHVVLVTGAASGIGREIAIDL
ncbi:MAG TPA: class II aldolase/adducin family protein, partial [Candidatus Limnocylindrales bacterium]|nr:class II aldolase/adducin family protein [Candidatus Limnocylindrales bacterium]